MASLLAPLHLGETVAAPEIPPLLKLFLSNLITFVKVQIIIVFLGQAIM